MQPRWNPICLPAATFEQTLIQRRLGVLSADDKAVLRKLIRDVLG
jgi:hypothetical protein